MSTTPRDDETQLETQGIQLQEEDTQDVEDQEISVPNPDAQPAAIKPKKREKKETVALVREPGKSLLPFSRVQKIVKADKEIPIVARDATYLISLAAEEFIKRLCEAGQQIAHREKRSTVQHRDIATVVRKADEFLFLEEIMPWTSADPPAKRPKPQGTGVKASGPTLLDQFVVNKKGAGENVDGEDIIMNEDGTMYASGTTGSPGLENDNLD